VLTEVEKRRATGEVVDFARLRYMCFLFQRMEDAEIILFYFDRTGIAAGSPIPIDLMKSLIEKLNLRDLTVAYGMSAPSRLSYF
jgi:hypothetical protein